MNNTVSVKPKKKYIPLAVITLLILAVVAIMWFISRDYAYRDQKTAEIPSDSGVWDLRGYDFDAEIQFLGGKVEYVPNELLTPEEFNVHDKILRGSVPSDMNAATARLTLLIKPGRYMLSANSIDYNERIYIDGELRHEAGKPGLTADDSVAGARYMKFEVYTDGVIEIVRQSSNFVHKENCGFAGIWIGSVEIMQRMIALQEMPSAVMLGLYLALFLTHLTAFLLFREYRPNLWFALICFGGLIWEGFSGRKIYFTMFPDLPWSVMYRAVCCAAALAGVMILLLLRDEFPGIIQKWVLRAFIGAYAALSAFFLLADTVLVSYVKSGVEILIGMSAIYIAARFIFTRKRRQESVSTEQLLTVIGVIFALLTFLHDAFRYNNLPIIFQYEVAGMGALALMLFQTAAMFYGTMRKYAEAKREAAELAAKTDFYRRMSHDLRTPLTVISTGVQVALRRPEEAPELLTRAQSEIMKMAGMIDQALGSGDWTVENGELKVEDDKHEQ
ncbi:hypothetical protein FACS1894219_02040 [Clostridia bacterium]|nr:hypothetical protein FACS1894219_02040 [Clostridia bacterium]